MAKFGEFTFGTGTLYGAGQTAQPSPTFTGRYLWILEVAWDGNFDGTNEAAGRLVAPVSWTRGKTAYINRQGTGLEPIYPGELTLTLENYDGRYDPYNASGVLNGVVPQGLEMRLRVCEITAGTPGTPEPVFAGYIKDIQPVSGGLERVTVTCVDEIENIANQDITTALVFNTTPDAAIRSILDASGISNYWLDNSQIPLTLFSLSNANAMQEINELAGAALGEVFVTRDGTLKFYSLTYNSMASHTITQAEVLKEFSIAQPWDTKRTHIKVAANRWARTQVKRLWQSPQDIALTAGQTKTFSAEWSGICEPVQLDPTKGDYSLVGQGYLGGGAWISAYLSNITSSGCTVTITNSGPFPTSTYIVIRGREYVQSYPAQAGGYVPWQSWVPTTQKQNSTKVLCTAGDDAIPQRKRSYMRMDNRYIQDANFAQLWANTLKTHLENGAKNPEITLQTYEPSFAHMFGIELFDKVHFTSAAKSIDNDYYLGQVRGEWLNENGQDVRMEYTLINHLYANVTTASEGITEINDEIPEGGGGNQTEDNQGNPQLPPEVGADCKEDAPANGPYSLGGTGQYYNLGGTNFINTPFICRVRGAASHINETIVQLTGYAEETADAGNTWTPCAVPALSIYLYQGTTVVQNTTMTNGLASFQFAGTLPITSIAVGIETSNPDYRYTYTGSGTDIVYGSEGMSIDEQSGGLDLGGNTDTSHGTLGYLYVDIGFTPDAGSTFYFRVQGGSGYVIRKVSGDGVTWSDSGSGIGLGGGWQDIGFSSPPRYCGLLCYSGSVPFAYVKLDKYTAQSVPTKRINITGFTISNVCPPQ